MNKQVSISELSKITLTTEDGKVLYAGTLPAFSQINIIIEAVDMSIQPSQAELLKFAKEGLGVNVAFKQLAETYPAWASQMGTEFEAYAQTRKGFGGFYSVEAYAQGAAREAVASEIEKEKAEREAAVKAQSKAFEEKVAADRAEREAAKAKAEAERAERLATMRFTGLGELKDMVLEQSGLSVDIRFPYWVKRVTGVDESKQDGFMYEGEFIKDGTVQAPVERTVFIAATQTGSRKNSFTTYRVIVMNSDGSFTVTPIETNDKTRGWALRIRDDIKALL